LEVHLLPPASRARVLVREFGADLLDRLFPLVEEMDRGGVSRIYLDLPLADPGTASFAAPVEALGFSFAGVLPEQGGGDLLRLQHLREAPAGRPEFSGLTDFGEELLDYVWKGINS
jgi:serine/threonine-protein kinase RsbW